MNSIIISSIVAVLAMCLIAEAFPRAYLHIEEDIPLSQSKSKCLGRIPEGNFCGAAPDLCCGMTSCQMFNFFQRSFTPCSKFASHEDCSCMPITTNFMNS